MWKLFIVFLLLPNFVFAKEYVTPSGVKIEADHPTWQYVTKIFTLPSGLAYAAVQLVSVARASEDIPLIEQIKIWIDRYEEIYKVGNMKELAECESNYQTNALGDLGKSYGIFQWQAKSWAFYNKKFRTQLDREDWRHQIARSYC